MTTRAPAPGADGDRQLAVLHRGIEGLLDRAREAVDLVDEEDGARLERGQERGDVGLALERRAGGLARTGRSARRRRSAPARSCPGRAGRPAARGRAPRRAPRRRAIETPSCSLSASWPTNSSSRARAQRGVDARPRGARAGPGCGRRRGADRSSPRRPCSAWAIRSSGVSPGAPSSSLSASCGLKPRPSRPSRASSRGSSPRVITIGVARGARADLLAQLDDDPLGRALADPGHGLQPRGVAGRDGAEQLARRAAGEHGQRHLRPDRTARRSASGTGRAPPRWRSRSSSSASSRTIRWVCSVAALPAARDVPQRLGRDGQPVADAAAGDDDVVGAAHRDLAGEQRDHAAASAAAQRRAVGVADRDRERVGRVVGPRQLGSASSVCTIRCTWSLAARPEPQTAPLTCCGV